MTLASTAQLSIGLHRDIPADNYHKLPYASNSRLSTLAASCPAKVRYEMDHPKEPTPAFVLGQAVHCLVLESDNFTKSFAVAPACDRRTTIGKGIWANFIAHNDCCTILTAEQDEQAHAIAESVLDNDLASALLCRATEREVSAIWEDESGLLCKARFDGLSTDEDAPFILDLKTTEDASPRGFERSIDTYGIARQGAFYLAGAAKLGLAIEDFVIVAVEKSPPYLTAVHRISDAALEAARRELRPLIEAYWLAESMGDWIGYQPRDADLPAWAMKRIGNQ